MKRKTNTWYQIGHSLSTAFFELVYNAEAYGIYNVPTEGPFLLACNHKSLFDPFLAACFIKRPIYFFAKKNLFKGKIISSLLKNWNAIPVDRETGDLQAMKTVLNLLKQGDPLLIFPEGTRGSSHAKKGVGMMAHKTQVPIIPTYIAGTEKAWPQGQTIPSITATFSVTYGEPIYPQDLEKDYQATADHIMQAIYNLAKN